MKYLLIVFLTILSLSSYSQEGTIRGTVIDDETGETLVGVSVLVKGTTSGTITDLDGKFSIDQSPGNYTLQLSYISYQTLVVEEIEVTAGETTLLNNLRLKESVTELGEVVVTANQARNTDAALQTMKRKSASIMDGISAAKIELTGDGTAVEAAKRVTGVSIEGGKYVYIRGLGDRYSKTTLNSIDIPGLDPDRNTLQMDIFPTNLIDNITVKKNFTADLPADFTGGLLNVETKDFPDKQIFNISLGTSYNPSMNLNPDFITYEGGKTDFLGFDDGTRALPEKAKSNNIPVPYSGYSDEEVNQFIKSFNPKLGAIRQNSMLDLSASMSLGNQIELGDQSNGNNQKLGYIFSLSYKSEYTYYDDVFFGEYQRRGDPETYEMKYATERQGEMGEHNVLAGALGGIAYKTNYSKIRLTAMHLQKGTSRAGLFNIKNSPDAVGQSGYRASSDNLEYNQRSLTNILLHGKHVIDQSDLEIDWRVSPTFSSSKDPDIRNTAFTEKRNDTLFNAGAGGNPSRLWRDLDQINIAGKIDITKRYQLIERKAKIKFGISHTYKDRSYEILQYDMGFTGNQEWPVPEANEVLNPSYIYPNQPNGVYYQNGNNDPNSNAYESNSSNSSIYVSNEFEPLRHFKTIIGLRAEQHLQRHTGRDQSEKYVLDNDKVIDAMDLFPSVNFIYSLTEKQNLRLAYNKSIARPSFKEMSFAQILDPISNRIFNGSFFIYDNWDGDLKETRIDNLDLRWELFFNRGQMFSISTFYKHFNQAIELVRIPEQQTSTEYQPRNVGDGDLYGLEIEFNKDLNFIHPAWRNLNLNGNLTLVESNIEMSENEFNSRKQFEKEGQTIEKTRQMAGQSPYVINAGLTYSNPQWGLATGAFYNVKGPTLQIVGGGLFPDIYMESYHSLDFSINKKLGQNKKTLVELKISNILNDKKESLYKSFKASPKTYSSYNPGRTFSLGVKYKF